MIPQEIFDTVAKHLFAQGTRSADKRPAGGFQCKYRGPDGTKCAVGVLIPDGLYDPDMEGTAICGLFDPDATSEGGFPLPVWMKHNLSLLIKLQESHDCVWNWYGSDRMKERLQKVAEDHGLSADVLKDLKFPD